MLLGYQRGERPTRAVGAEPAQYEYVLQAVASSTEWFLEPIGDCDQLVDARDLKLQV